MLMMTISFSVSFTHSWLPYSTYTTSLGRRGFAWKVHLSAENEANLNPSPPPPLAWGRTISSEATPQFAPIWGRMTFIFLSRVNTAEICILCLKVMCCS